MLHDKRLAVVVPAYNEETLIQKVIDDMPAEVDCIIVVDDHSSDRTVEVVSRIQKQNDRVHLIEHKTNTGVGGAITSGYEYARDEAFDVTVVMAGDAQMDPEDLPAVAAPVARGEVDYCKGNRLFTGKAFQQIPKVRYFGNACLSLLTKIASGYWHVADSQTGYTAINLRMLKLIDWSLTYRRYGCPNDYLVRLNIYDAKVRDVPIKPVYGIGEKSGIRLHVVIPRMTWLLIRLFIKRMVQKYIIRDFHPLVLFYGMSFALLIPGALFGLGLIAWRLMEGPIAATSAMFAAFLFISGIQFGLFAMFMDMEVNKGLR